MTQTTTSIGRSKFANPDLGYDVTDGGTNLHAALTAMHTAASNNLSARWFTAQVIANASYVDLTHNFGLTSIDDIGVHLYQSNAEVALPTGVSLTAQSTNVLRISNASGGSLTFDVLISAVPDVTKYAQTFAGLKTFSNGISTDTIVEKTAGAGVTFSRGTSVSQTFNPAAAQDIQSLQKKTGLACLATSQYAATTIAATVGTGDFTFIVTGKSNTDTVGSYEIFGCAGSSSNDCILVGVNNSGNYYAGIGPSIAVTSSTPKTKTPVTLIVQRAAGVLSLYVNGKLAVTPVANTVSLVSSNILLGLYILNTLPINGTVHRAGLLNYALPEDKIRRYSAGERLDWEDLGGSMTAITSGTITIGKRYRITVNGGSGIFTNVGAAANTVGTEFTATGTTPTAWTGSELIALGALAAYEGENLLPSAATWPDSSGNANDLTIVGATTINLQDSLELTDKLIVGGNSVLGKTSGSNVQHAIKGGNNGASSGDYPLIIDNYNATSGTSAGMLSFRVGVGVYPGISINPTSGATIYSTSSDERLKKDFENFSGLSILDKISVYKYSRISASTQDYGCKAQELHKHFPNAVVVGDSGKEVKTPWSVDYSVLVPILVKAFQEQQDLIDSLTHEINKIKGNVGGKQ
jgi:hypothetical protein